MKFSAATLLACATAASAFSAVPLSSRNSAVSSLSASVSDSVDRRQVFHLLGGAAFSFGTVMAPKPASAGLLDEYGTDMKITNKVVPETKAPVVAQPKGESSFEPNLRSNYYYPTNKKRYLPRIKKCNDAIPDAATAIGTEDWEAAVEFATKVADDTVLPMRLYTSSLSGGGTNVKVSFAKDMNKAADDFERAQKKLAKSIAKKDRETSSRALEDLASALSMYREAGRLTGPDGGGDIPSVDEIRRSACRVQGRTFEQKVKDRDARLKEAAAVTSVASAK